MSAEALAQLWFLILGILLVGYAILDGFDLGVGILHPFLAREDRERRLSLNSIGPLWDGNEVWLVTFAGGLFAAFPTAYAAVLSGFYTATVLLLCCLIFRAVSIEFRSKRPSPLWRSAWDYGFCLSSGGAALIFGVVVGNTIRGVPLDASGRYTGSLLDQLNGYSLAVGALSVALLALHGSLFLRLKTSGPLAERARRAGPWLFGLFAALYVGVTAWTLLTLPQATAALEAAPVLWAIPILNLLAVLNVPRALHHGRPGYAFFSSCCVIAALVALFGLAQFPRLLSARPDLDASLTIYNAASSPGTLKLMSLIALIGMPLVLSYTGLVYWTFRGQVELDEHSY